MFIIDFTKYGGRYLFSCFASGTVFPNNKNFQGRKAVNINITGPDQTRAVASWRQSGSNHNRPRQLDLRRQMERERPSRPIE
jgi:hypothetical protein